MRHGRSQGARSISEDLGGARNALGQQRWVMTMRAELVFTSLLGRIRGSLVVGGADRDRSTMSTRCMRPWWKTARRSCIPSKTSDGEYAAFSSPTLTAGSSTLSDTAERG